MDKNIDTGEFRRGEGKYICADNAISEIQLVLKQLMLLLMTFNYMFCSLYAFGTSQDLVLY